jgi:hypothetical protein
MLPMAATRYPFSLWSRPLFSRESLPNFDSYLKAVSIIERHVIIPMFFAAILNHSYDGDLGLPNGFESIMGIVMVMASTSLAHAHPFRFCLVLTLVILTVEDHQFLLFRVFVYHIVCWKVLELREKFQFVFRYSSLHSLTSKFQMLVLGLILANTQFVILMTLFSAVFGAPIVAVSGFTFYLPSFARPTTFWDDPLTFEPKPGDTLFYRVISDNLGETFGDFVSGGRFIDVTENSFYLICDDYFNAIIHVVAVGAGYLVFQLRGLEVREQTLCHQNELNVVRRELDEIDDTRIFTLPSIFVRFTSVIWRLCDKVLHLWGFPPILGDRARAFLRSATWKTLHDDLPIPSYSVSANRLDLIFPDKHHQAFISEALFKVLTVILDESDQIESISDWRSYFTAEFVQDGLEWIDAHGKSESTDRIFAVCQVLLSHMSTIAGGFEWQVYQMFIARSFRISTFWMSPALEAKLILGFRVAIHVAIHLVVGDLGTDVDELTSYIRHSLSDCRFLPEDDPGWSPMVFAHVDCLETLRQTTDDAGLTVKHIRFTYGEHSFKVIQLNRESVMGIWAGQIFETMYIETDDRERTSVQFDQFILRNIISQSANSPIGYPETICPLTYSFSRR